MYQIGEQIDFQNGQVGVVTAAWRDGHFILRHGHGYAACFQDGDDGDFCFVDEDEGFTTNVEALATVAKALEGVQ
jgi:hypothetical protein